MTLEFAVQEQTISKERASSRRKVVANSRNYLRAAFTFSEDWTGIITAVFEHPTIGAKAVLIGSDGVCLVPWEVIQPPHFTVGAFCGSRVTSNRAQIFVQESVSLDTTATAAPTPSVYEQILTLLENSGIGAGGIAVEKDPTVPACVKGITEADIRKWHAALAAESDPTVPDCVKSITPEQIAQWNTPAAFSGLSDAEKEALIHAVAEGLLYTEEEWTFTLDSGEIVTKKVVLGT